MSDHSCSHLRVCLNQNLIDQFGVFFVAGEKDSLANPICTSNFDAVLQYLSHNLPDGVFVVQLGIDFIGVGFFGCLNGLAVFVESPVLIFPFQLFFGTQVRIDHTFTQNH